MFTFLALKLKFWDDFSRHFIHLKYDWRYYKFMNVRITKQKQDKTKMTTNLNITAKKNVFPHLFFQRIVILYHTSLFSYVSTNTNWRTFFRTFSFVSHRSFALFIDIFVYTTHGSTSLYYRPTILSNFLYYSPAP